MIPILYGSTETQFSNNGIGYLSEAASCKVVEERNGKFELEMKYPVSGIRFADITNRKIIFAKPSTGKPEQPFRIYKITKPSNGLITVHAQHISYDLSGVPVSPFSAGTAAAAISSLSTKALTPVTNYSFQTDIVRNGNFELVTPASMRSILGGREGSILDVYHGEWEFDFNKSNKKTVVTLHESRGADNGVLIAYGKNLTTLEQEENISAVYTGILPYYYSESDGLVQGNIQNAPGTFDFVRVLPMDFSSEYQEKPTVQALNARAIKYIQDNDIGVPEVSLKVSFVELSKASGYEKIAMLENVELCDEVTVKFEKLNISTKAKVVKTEYDVLKDRYTYVDIGKVKDGIAKTIAEQGAEIKRATTRSDMQKAIKYATELITGAKGGYVLINDSDGDGFPDEILIMDTEDKETAVNVWRWNKNGLGFSSNGYAGPYGLAMTIDGSIVADYITSGTINADNVNVTNINGQNIKEASVAAARLSSGVQGTLTQVGVNAADIQANAYSIALVNNTVAAYMKGSLTASQINAVNGSFTNLFFAGRTCRVMGFLDYLGNQRYCIGFE